eukprot:5033527-Karenia_brevis.AAC.1
MLRHFYETFSEHPLRCVGTPSGQVSGIVVTPSTCKELIRALRAGRSLMHGSGVILKGTTTSESPWVLCCSMNIAQPMPRASIFFYGYNIRTRPRWLWLPLYGMEYCMAMLAPATSYLQHSALLRSTFDYDDDGDDGGGDCDCDDDGGDDDDGDDDVDDDEDDDDDDD